MQKSNVIHTKPVTLTATHCNTLQRTATCSNLHHARGKVIGSKTRPASNEYGTATNSNTLQHTATHCNTLQHTPTHCNALQYTAAHCTTQQPKKLVAKLDRPVMHMVLQHSATQCNTLQHTATHCNRVQHAQY